MWRYFPYKCKGVPSWSGSVSAYTWLGTSRWCYQEWWSEIGCCGLVVGAGTAGWRGAAGWWRSDPHWVAGAIGVEMVLVSNNNYYLVLVGCWCQQCHHIRSITTVVISKYEIKWNGMKSTVLVNGGGGWWSWDGVCVIQIIIIIWCVVWASAVSGTNGVRVTPRRIVARGSPAGADAIRTTTPPHHCGGVSNTKLNNKCYEQKLMQLWFAWGSNPWPQH